MYELYLDIQLEGCPSCASVGTHFAQVASEGRGLKVLQIGLMRSTLCRGYQTTKIDPLHAKSTKFSPKDMSLHFTAPTCSIGASISIGDTLQELRCTGVYPTN